jgi:hypothetical protein
MLPGALWSLHFRIRIFRTFLEPMRLSQRYLSKIKPVSQEAEHIIRVCVLSRGRVIRARSHSSTTIDIPFIFTNEVLQSLPEQVDYRVTNTHPNSPSGVSPKVVESEP